MKLKYLIPYDKISLQTRLTTQEVQRKLDSVTAPRRGYFTLKRTIEPYEGKVAEESFRINRIIYYRRNSFLPSIIGNIRSGLNGTIVQIKMRPVWMVLIFMAIWLGIVGSVCVTVLYLLIANFNKTFTQGLSPAAIIPFAMFIFGYGILMIGYRVESSKSRDFFKDLLEAEES